jgi:YVTN family beta-propeller protein
MLRKYATLFISLIFMVSSLSNIKAKTLELQKTITGRGLSPKSVVYAGKGLFFAQNMMYNHNISVYNRQFERIKIINDAVDLSKYGFKGYEGTFMGAPVECAFSQNGLYAWVSNYQMYGKGFNNAGEDNCPTRDDYDHSFLYKINTQTLTIEDVIEVGAVPKYVAVTPDSRYVLVSNWCSGDVTIVDTRLGKAVKTVSVGAHPRGIVVDNASQKAYVAVMGSSKISVINLKNFSASSLTNVGSTPRHLCISPDNNFLYVTLNSEGKVAKVDLRTGKIIDKVRTGNAPRSMAMLGNGMYLYVVNYFSNTLSKVRAADMKVVEKVSTGDKPIGVTTDTEAQTVWVACYSGSIMVFQDTELKAGTPANVEKPEKVEKPHDLADIPDNYRTKAPVTIPESTANTVAETLRIKPNPTSKSRDNVNTVATTPKIETKPRQTAPVAVANTTPNKGFYIIVGSCTSPTKAEEMLNEWKAHGIPKAQIVAANDHFRIAAHYFKTKNDADKALVKVQKKFKSDAWILEH